MDVARAVVLVTAGAVVFLALLTGPAGPLTVPADGSFGAGLATGNASVAGVEFPDDPTLSGGRYEAGQFVLRVGDVAVRVSDVTGRPLLVYKLDVRGLEYTRSSLTVLEPGMEGSRAISLSRATLEGSSVTRDAYPGELKLVLRGDGPDRSVATRNVTVSVQR
mgnify:CR=1 FL=1